MSFYTRQEGYPMKPEVKFGNTDIAYKLRTKFLGLNISEYKNWMHMVGHQVPNSEKCCYMIKSLKDVMSNDRSNKVK
jgi:hypothetical protein